jgi:Antitoxin Phd_YefM, type II toxin-antitoxin system
MDRCVEAHIARTQFGQIMDLATKNNERFIADRRGEPAVVIMSVQDFIRTAAPPPDWLQKAWNGAKRRGLDSLTRADIDAEITAHRSKKNPVPPGGMKWSEHWSIPTFWSPVFSLSTRDIALEVLVTRPLDKDDQKLLALMTKRVGVALRLQRLNNIVRSSSGPGNSCFGKLHANIEKWSGIKDT